MISLLGWIIPVVLMIAILVDIITIGEHRIKNLNKFFWIVIVIILPLVGSVLWLLVGREYNHAPENVSFGDPRRQDAVRQNFISDEARIDAEIEFHEREARIRRLEEQVNRKR